MGGDIGAPALSCNSTEFMKYIALWFALAFFELEYSTSGRSAVW